MYRIRTFKQLLQICTRCVFSLKEKGNIMKNGRFFKRTNGKLNSWSDISWTVNRRVVSAEHRIVWVKAFTHTAPSPRCPTCMPQRIPGTLNVMDFTPVTRLCPIQRLLSRKGDYAGSPNPNTGALWRQRVFSGWLQNKVRETKCERDLTWPRWRWSQVKGLTSLSKTWEHLRG